MTELEGKIAYNGKKKPKKRAKRLSILKAAEGKFAAHGCHEATIADMARKAHISEATIYEYFSSKEDLPFSIPAEAISHSHQKIKEMFEFVKGAANKSRTLIYRHLRLYTDNRISILLQGSLTPAKKESQCVDVRMERIQG